MALPLNWRNSNPGVNTTKGRTRRLWNHQDYTYMFNYILSARNSQSLGKDLHGVAKSVRHGEKMLQSLWFENSVPAGLKIMCVLLMRAFLFGCVTDLPLPCCHFWSLTLTAHEATLKGVIALRRCEWRNAVSFKMQQDQCFKLRDDIMQ